MMKPKALLAALLCAAFSFAPLYAQENAAIAAAPTAPAGPVAELQALVERITTKLRAGQRTAAELTPELAEFEALHVKYRGQKTDESAQILFMLGALHAQVFGDLGKAREIFVRLRQEFPGTATAGRADAVLENLDRSAKAQAAQNAIVGQPAPELHFNWASRDGLKSLSSLKGKVVVLDFWATWCGPCVASFPHVRELTQHYQGLEVVVVGVTSIQGRVMGLEPPAINTEGDPAREMALMKDYIKAKDMTWTIAFSEEPVFNPDYGVTSIPHMAIIAPDGTVRHTGLHPAAPQEEKVAKIDAILKEFGKPTVASAKSRPTE